MQLPHNHGQEIEKLKNMPKEEDFNKVSNIFKLLDDSSRIRIFWLLCHCEECVINISVLLQMSSPAVSHHLRILKAYNLVITRRDGKEVYYKAAQTTDAEMLHNMIESIVEIKCPTK